MSTGSSSFSKSGACSRIPSGSGWIFTYQPSSRTRHRLAERLGRQREAESGAGEPCAAHARVVQLRDVRVVALGEDDGVRARLVVRPQRREPVERHLVVGAVVVGCTMMPRSMPSARCILSAASRSRSASRTRRPVAAGTCRSGRGRGTGCRSSVAAASARAPRIRIERKILRHRAVSHPITAMKSHSTCFSPSSGASIVPRGRESDPGTFRPTDR